MTVAFRIGAATDVGISRDLNQDSYAIKPEIVVVADGMGGHRGGEVASSIAAQEVIGRVQGRDLQLLVDAVTSANTKILDRAAANPRLHGMGTTVVALALIDVAEAEMLGVVNVGDSRMYRLTGNVLEQLTVDHSLVEALVREGRITPEQAETHPQRNIVTRALGVVEDVEVDVFHFIPKIGDRYLLSSDGLFDEVNAHEIATLLATYANPQECAEALVNAANASGGRDNITTVLVDIVEPSEAAMCAAPIALADDNPGAEPRSVPSAAPSTGSASAVSHDGPPVPADQAPDAPATPNDRQRWSWRR